MKNAMTPHPSILRQVVAVLDARNQLRLFILCKLMEMQIWELLQVVGQIFVNAVQKFEQPHFQEAVG